MYRVILLLTVVIGSIDCALADELRPSPSNADQQRQDSSDVRIILELQSVTIVGDEALEQLQKVTKLPELHGQTVLDDEQLLSLIEAAHRHKNANVLTYKSPQSFPSGEENKGPAATGIDTFKETVSADRQTVDLRITFHQGKEWKIKIPAISGTVPLGSSLLTHSWSITETITLSSGFLGDVVDKLFSLKRTHTQSRHVYLIVTPRIARSEQYAGGVK